MMISKVPGPMIRDNCNEAASREATTASDSDAGIFKSVSFNVLKRRYLVSLFNYVW